MIKAKLAKWYMQLRPSIEPEFDTDDSRNETIFHSIYLNATQEEKNDILKRICQSNFDEEEKFPIDSYFNYYGINPHTIFNGKDVLDLGCGYGGRSICLADRFKVKSMAGVEVNSEYIKAARLFSESKQFENIKFNFREGFGEELPFEDNSFDVVYSFDVIEHVPSVTKVLDECKRVVRDGGFIIHIFPSYFMPTQSHLGFATKMRMTQWFFSAANIQKAYDEIMNTRSSTNFWYHGHKTEEEKNANWQAYNAGIGVNGTTFKKYEKILSTKNFRKTSLSSPPLGSCGYSSYKNSKIKWLSSFLRPFLKVKMLQDFLGQRIVSIIVK